MATFSEAFAALDEYRSAVQSARQNEDSSESTSAFAARGAFSAFATPLTNVHATGVGIRLRNEKIVEDDYVLKVYVFDKQELGARTPSITKGNFQGVGIDVEHLPVQLALPRTGAIRALATTPDQHQDRRRPVVGGIQISPLGAEFVGTLGCLVRRGTQLFALSNNHVLADTNRLPIGTKIVQSFGSSDDDVFARLIDFEPIRFPNDVEDGPRNRMDAAIATIVAPNLVRRRTIFGVPNYTPELKAARPGMAVTKAGRTTAVTFGRITAIRVNGVAVDYGEPGHPVIATFDNCVQILGNAGQPFSRPGDSGSAILETASGKPVALLFAGDRRSTTACDMTAVCTRFNVVPS
jgi:hypothetical protein